MRKYLVGGVQRNTECQGSSIKLKLSVGVLTKTFLVKGRGEQEAWRESYTKGQGKDPTEVESPLGKGE